MIYEQIIRHSFDSFLCFANYGAGNGKIGHGAGQRTPALRSFVRWDLSAG